MKMKEQAIVVAAVLALVFAAVAAAGYSARGTVAPDAVAALYTKGMTCGSCSGRIEAALGHISGVDSVETDVERGIVVASYDSKQVQAAKIAETVSGLGYAASVAAVMTMDEFRSESGRAPGQAQPSGGGCACCSKK